MKLLVCGSRNTGHHNIIRKHLDILSGVTEVIEGCCPNSADVIAEEWAQDHNIPLRHFPANSGNYLKRNIEMVDACDTVLAFWNGFSYGTAHTIAQGVLKGKKVVVVRV